MKLVKKILRLLPLLMLLYTAVFCIFSKNTNVLEMSPTDLFDLLTTFFVGNINSFDALLSNSFISSLGLWFTNNFGQSLLISFPIAVMFYELVLSLIFLIFDFINIVFDWGNKFIKKGRNIDD